MAIVGRRVVEAMIERALWACAALSVLVTVGIVGVLAWEAAAFFRDVSPVAFLTGRTWTPLFRTQSFGVLPIVAGTVLVMAIAMLVAVPAGLVSALYLSEYAPPRVRRMAKPALEVLAGVPTVVYGYFALLFVTPWLRTWIPGLAGFNALGPGLVMGLMILPLVSSLCDDAFSAVPQGLREGAFALGATRLQAATGVVLPAAMSGVSAAVHPRDLARHRRDDDRGHRRRPATALHRQPARADRNDDRLHRPGQSRRRADRHTRVQDHLRRRHAAVCGTLALNLCSDWLRRRMAGAPR